MHPVLVLMLKRVYLLTDYLFFGRSASKCGQTASATRRVLLVQVDNPVTGNAGNKYINFLPFVSYWLTNSVMMCWAILVMRAVLSEAQPDGKIAHRTKFRIQSKIPV